MAVPTLPKSEARMAHIHNVSVGYGEIPAMEVGDKIGWCLPGEIMTLNRKVAEKFAARIDAVIREGMQSSPRKSLI